MTRLMQEMQANLGSQEDINRMEEHRLARINQIDRLVQQAQQFHVSYFTDIHVASVHVHPLHVADIEEFMLCLSWVCLEIQNL